MKQFLTLLVAALVAAVPAWAQTSGSSRLGVGARYHMDHSAFEDLPYADGDFSYGLLYEFHEDAACWQIAVDYGPQPGGTNNVDYVITPQLSLIAKDNMWRGGLGILSTYQSYEDGDSDWTGIYWQFILGIELPIARFPLQIYASYVFESWDKLSDFELGDIEYGAWLSYAF